MDPVSIVLAASSSKLVLEALKVFSEQLRPEGQRPKSTKLQAGGGAIHLNRSDASAEDVARLRGLLQAVGKTSASLLRLSREATKTDQTPVPMTPESTELGAAALAIDANAVFADARHRMGLVFRMNLAIAIVLAVVLFAGLGAAGYAAIKGNNIWAAAFGGISAADILGLYLLKPLTAMNSSLLGTQRLELLHLRLRQQLVECALHKKLPERIRCQTKVWKSIQDDLALLAGTASSSSAPSPTQTSD